MLQVIFEKLDSSAVIPTKGSTHAACWDVYSPINYCVSNHEVTVISTRLKVKIPIGYMLHVVPRSGLAIKNGIITMAGIIDSDYRGELSIALYKVTPKRHKIKSGDRIAQLQLHLVPEWECIAGQIDDITERGSAGFGSTGR